MPARRSGGSDSPKGGIVTGEGQLGVPKALGTPYFCTRVFFYFFTLCEGSVGSLHLPVGALGIYVHNHIRRWVPSATGVMVQLETHSSRRADLVLMW